MVDATLEHPFLTPEQEAEQQAPPTLVDIMTVPLGQLTQGQIAEYVAALKKEHAELGDSILGDFISLAERIQAVMLPRVVSHHETNGNGQTTRQAIIDLLAQRKKPMSFADIRDAVRRSTGSVSGTLSACGDFEKTGDGFWKLK